MRLRYIQGAEVNMDAKELAEKLNARLHIKPGINTAWHQGGHVRLQLDLPEALAYLRTQEPLASSPGAARDRLAHLRDLKPGWDSYGGVPITADALRVADYLLTTPGQPVPRSNGGIQIEWHGAGVDVEICIEPDGKIEEETQELGDEAFDRYFSRLRDTIADLRAQLYTSAKRIFELELQLQTATAALEAAREDGERLRKALGEMISLADSLYDQQAMQDESGRSILESARAALSAPAAEPQAEHADKSPPQPASDASPPPEAEKEYRFIRAGHGPGSLKNIQLQSRTKPDGEWQDEPETCTEPHIPTPDTAK